MAIAVHIINKPQPDAREAYARAWELIDRADLHHAEGRQSHTAWLVGDVFHVLDVWDSPEHMEAFLGKMVPILDEVGMTIDGQPEVGDLLNIVRPD